MNWNPNLPLLLSDPSELREALINLVFNAVDALPHGGIITFVTRCHQWFPVPKTAEPLCGDCKSK